MLVRRRTAYLALWHCGTQQYACIRCQVPHPANSVIAAATGARPWCQQLLSAVCCVLWQHRYGVAIGSTLAPLVRVLMVLCSPITWPLGKLLDCILGHENVTMKRQQLKAMVQLHGEGAGEGRTC